MSRVIEATRRSGPGGPAETRRRPIIFKHLRLLVRYWVITFKEFAAYTWDVYLALLQFGLFMGRSFVFWWALLGTAGAFGGWGLPEIALFTALSYLPGAHELFWNFWNRASLSDKVLRGDLDKYLARPVHPLFALAAEDVNLASFIRYGLPPLALVVTIVRLYRLPVGVGSFLLGYVVLSLGKFALVLIRATVAMLAFRHGEVSQVQRFFFQLTAFASYPVTVFPAGLRAFLSYVLPVGFVATYPTLVMLGRSPALPVLAGAAALCLVWLALLARAWRAAVAGYDSPGG